MSGAVLFSSQQKTLHSPDAWLRHSQESRMERHLRNKSKAAEDEGATSGSEDGGEAGGKEGASVCLVCHKSPIEYACVPCGCHTCCKKCA